MVFNAYVRYDERAGVCAIVSPGVLCCCKHRHRTADVSFEQFSTNSCFPDLPLGFSENMKYCSAHKMAETIFKPAS